MSVNVKIDHGGTSWDGTFETGHPPSIEISASGQGSLHLCIVDAEVLLRLLGKALDERKRRDGSRP